MNNAQKFIQAYRNAPWRRQLQILGYFGVFAVVLSLVFIVYIWMTSQAGAYGLEVRKNQNNAQIIEQRIEDKKVILADLTSTESLAQRAKEAGYQAVDPNRIRYLEVDGYYEEPPLQLAPARNAVQPAAPDDRLPSEFTASLIDWLGQALYQLRLGATGTGE